MTCVISLVITYVNVIYFFLQHSISILVGHTSEMAGCLNLVTDVHYIIFYFNAIPKVLVSPSPLLLVSPPQCEQDDNISHAPHQPFQIPIKRARGFKTLLCSYLSIFIIFPTPPMILVPNNPTLAATIVTLSSRKSPRICIEFTTSTPHWSLLNYPQL